MFKVNNKDARRHQRFSSISFFNFEHVIAGWDVTMTLLFIHRQNWKRIIILLDFLPVMFCSNTFTSGGKIESIRAKFFCHAPLHYVKKCFDGHLLFY